MHIYGCIQPTKFFILSCIFKIYIVHTPHNWLLGKKIKIHENIYHGLLNFVYRKKDNLGS